MWRWMWLKLEIKLALILTGVYLLVGIVTGVGLYYVFSGNYYEFFPAVWAFYWVTGMIMNLILSRNRHKSLYRLLSTFMICRMLKFLFTIAVLVLYVNLVGELIIAFSITLMIFYIAYMFLELYVYYQYDKKKKLHNNGSHK